MIDTGGAAVTNAQAELVLQAGPISNQAFAKWNQESNLPFPTASLQENRDKIRASWGVDALPWMILTDTDHKVTAEGFAVEELTRLVSAVFGN